MAARTNQRGLTGTADDALKDADVVIGVSAPGAFTAAGVRTMARDAIVFAMANPTPEVQPEEVWNDVAIIAKGNHIQHYLNGQLILDFTDNDPKLALPEGVLALQLHAGPPLWAEYKNIRLSQ